MGDESRLLLQERIRPAFEDMPFDVHSELGTKRIQKDLNILTFQSLADTESLAEQMNFAVNCDLTNKSHATSINRQSVSGYNETRRQFLKVLAPPILCSTRVLSL